MVGYRDGCVADNKIISDISRCGGVDINTRKSDVGVYALARHNAIRGHRNALVHFDRHRFYAEDCEHTEAVAVIGALNRLLRGIRDDIELMQAVEFIVFVNVGVLLVTYLNLMLLLGEPKVKVFILGVK